MCVCSGLKLQLNLTGLLTKANILIDETDRARISDFGLLKILSDPESSTSSGSYAQGGSLRWMSPELIDPRRFGLKKTRPTKFSDRYALGMVIYETVSGHAPFHQEGSHTAAVRNSTGEPPPRGVRFTDDLWEMLKKCWMFQPNDRPCIEDVLQCLKVSSSLPVALYPESDTEKDSHWRDFDSTNSLYGVLDLKVDTRMMEETIAPPRLDHLAGLLASKAHVNGADPTPWTGSENAGICQVTTIWFHILDRFCDIAQDLPTTAGVVEASRNSGFNAQKPDTHQGLYPPTVVPAIPPVCFISCTFKSFLIVNKIASPIFIFNHDLPS